MSTERPQPMGGAWPSRGLRLAVFPCLLAAGAISGCFFSSLPVVTDRSSERPNLNLNGAVPPISQVLNVTHGGPAVNFTVPFTSVDAGDDVAWLLWANWNLEGESREPPKNTLPARTSESEQGFGGGGPTERAVQFSWTPSGSLRPGCNQLTLFVTHFGNVDFSADRPIDVSKTAIATWWVNVDAPLDQQQTLASCPPGAAGP